MSSIWGVTVGTPQNPAKVIENTYTKTEVDEKLQNVSTGDVEGLVEITSGEPTKDGTVMTVNPNAEEVHLYTAEEIDAMFDALVNGNEVAY